MGIGNRIKEARENMNLTQVELAKLIGVTSSSITNYEKETSHPKKNIIYKLMNTLNIDANYLFQDVVTQKKSFIPTFPEQAIIKKYRQLDKPGKRHIDRTIDHELERITDTVKESSAPYTITSHSDKPLTKKQQNDLVAWDKIMREKRGK